MRPPAALAMLLLAGPMAAQGSEMTCEALHGPATRHHIVSIDLSRSTFPFQQEMKNLVSRYAKCKVQPQEMFTLIGFGMDSRGSVRNLGTWAMADSGTADLIDRALDDVPVPPADTKTYFGLLADYLNQYLPQVAVQPIILVLSDGQSDGLGKRGLWFREVPFESFGGGGIYSAHNGAWRVAVYTKGQQLSSLFESPLMRPRKPGTGPEPLSGALRTCLVEPTLRYQADESLVMRAAWNPLSHVRYGTLRIHLGSDCVTREHSFQVQLIRGGSVLWERDAHELVGSKSTELEFPVQLDQTGQSDGLAQIEITGAGVPMGRVVPYTRTPIRVQELSYWTTIAPVAEGVLMMVCAGVLFVWLQRSWRTAIRNREVRFAKVYGGIPVQMNGSVEYSIGGWHCEFAAPGANTQDVFGWIGLAEGSSRFRLRLAQGWAVEIDGQASASGGTSTSFASGQQLRFISGSRSYEVVLMWDTPWNDPTPASMDPLDRPSAREEDPNFAGRYPI
ncbi:MAG TPA: hypothetical protein VKU19_35285 [Bryobacteraceae bacterium]|nr:hypothetical protein [Bryobacteraceae bacterium]